ncbi:MAG TPA: hypothetical protein V6D47_17505 [Oscillatoriaceae cyanobacterium]
MDAQALHNLNEYLGPGLGFAFTTGVLLFIAFNAHRTARPVAPGQGEQSEEPSQPVEEAKQS